MVPFAKLITATIGISLREANDIIWENKLKSIGCSRVKHIQTLVLYDLCTSEISST